MKPSAKLLALAKRNYRYMFPIPKSLNEQTEQLLIRLYPNIDWSRIQFFEGMPWFIFGGFVAGIALPGTYDTKKVHIYLRKFSQDTEIGLSTIVHEGFHVLQYKDLGAGRGIGFFRLFMVHYLSNYLKLYFKYLFKYGFSSADSMAYEYHPMEIPAYKQEYNFRYLYKTQGIDAIDHKDFIACICEDSGHKDEAGWFFHLLTYLIVILLMILKPLVEIVLLSMAGIFWIFGQLLRLFRL